MTLPGNCLQDYTSEELTELITAITYGIVYMDLMDSSLSMVKRIEILNQFSVKAMEAKVAVRRKEIATEN